MLTLTDGSLRMWCLEHLYPLMVSTGMDIQASNVSHLAFAEISGCTPNSSVFHSYTMQAVEHLVEDDGETVPSRQLPVSCLAADNVDKEPLEKRIHKYHCLQHPIRGI